MKDKRGFIFFYFLLLIPTCYGLFPSCRDIGENVIFYGNDNYVCPSDGKIRIFENSLYPYPYGITCQCDNGAGCQLCSPPY